MEKSNSSYNSSEQATQSTQQVPSTEGGFWSRLTSIPLVQESLGKMHHYANQTTLSRYALQQAETTLTRATEIASPYANRYKNQLERADAIGCKSLDLLDGVRDRIDSTLITVTAPVNKQIIHAADNIESLVDRWLPPPKKASERQQEQPYAPAEYPPTPPQQNSDSEDEEEEEYDDERGRERRSRQRQRGEYDDAEKASQRFYQLANDVSQRLAQRMPSSRADIARLAETSRLLQETAGQIAKINASLQTWILHSRHLAGERVQEITHQIKGNYGQTITQERIHDLTVELVHRLDHASEYIKEQSVRLPTFMQSRLDPLLGFATHEYGIIRAEAIRSDLPPLQKATNIVNLTQAFVLPVLQTSIDSFQEQVRYYTVYASTSKDKVVNDIKATIGIVA
ncbi:hypothetical protein J3Q64DRAFT_1735460 [Phycomyces blakesleeanus]|uniref:Uncharacterized protein n=2 Tax=Phycomyces blakesleeanus TaxID=4837 RepID=A0A162UKC2_PHYB8|nr:hypothetical protein PHYBLDRAFT_75921 [Phycomyces blakesleeanus NRRL 1555(-)]OAD75943.1 hypothetical protein PHYBLDRAFT_75921 [Phycomyces blakesleeanus NRRL 1555(-)]|eukprot:XP_018293983.1 hypothetical protein PHYBLDRAFT_75921 [Phycomyces blakesleeanus NRRL 1555(-)]